VIPEIDIWRAANLMLKRYGEKALKESAARADELAAGGDYNGAAIWRRITDAARNDIRVSVSRRPIWFRISRTSGFVRLISEGGTTR
jgi:hypothetical protein